MPGVDALFSPYRLNALDLANRIVMAPMTRSRSPGGVPTDAVAAYYRRRAENGVGLIVTEATAVDRPAAHNEPDVPFFHGPAALAGWRKAVDEVHAAGGRIAPQLWHVGQKRSRETPDFTPSAPYESPSGRSMKGERTGLPMSEADIAATIDAFARAAADAERLGFDAVELHGGHNYLIDQFFWNHLNRRTDRYGGATLIARSRFVIEILKAIRSVVAPGFPVSLRLSQWNSIDFHARLAESPDVLEPWLNVLAEAGADAFHLSQQAFGEPAFPEIDPRLNLAGWAKKLTGAPVITVGSVGLSGSVYESFKGRNAEVASLDDMLARLERGEFDLVAVGRPFAAGRGLGAKGAGGSLRREPCLYARCLRHARLTVGFAWPKAEQTRCR